MKPLPQSLSKQFRAATITPPPTPDDRTVSFSLSSETPVEQWFGTEVLSHDPKAIRQGRLKQGIALLFNHDPNQHIGTIDSYDIKDRKLNVVARFGNSALANEKLQDVRDGVLKDASVGYIIHKIVREQDGELPSDADTANVTDWEPMEASLVPVPADPRVGVGRAQNDQEFPVAVEVHCRNQAAPAATPPQGAQHKMAVEATPAPATAGADNGAANELARTSAIMALATDKDFRKHFTIDDAQKAIAEKRTVDAVKDEICRKIVSAQDVNKVGTAGSGVVSDMSPKERARFSQSRLIRAMVNQARGKHNFSNDADATLEMEVSAEIGKRLNKQGIFVPNSLSARALETSTVASTVSTVTESTVIELLRNRPRVAQLGARVLGGLSGIIRLPRQSGAATAQWLAEGAAVTESDLTTDSISLSPHRISMQGAYSVELLAEASPDIEAMLRADQDRVVALALDLAAINGTGSSGQPLGILQASGLAAISSSGTTLASGGKALAYADVVSFESTVAEANADSVTSGWLFTPAVRGLLKTTQMFSGAAAWPIWPVQPNRDPSGLEDGPLGYKAGVTNQLPQNLTHSGVTGSVLHAAIFGDFGQVILADWGATEIIVDPYTQAASGLIVITRRSLNDVGIRHVPAFAACLTCAVS